MFKKLIHADVFFGAIFVFALLVLVDRVFQGLNTDIVDPIGQALDNFEMTDLVYTSVRAEPPKDTNITLVNIGNLSRAEIGRMIMNLNAHSPVVIGIDTRFIKDKTPYYLENGLEDGDSVLAFAFSQVRNLVLVTDMHRDANGQVSEVISSHPKFMKYATPAYANMITEEKSFRVAREILPKEMVKDKREVFFPVKVASFFDNTKAEKFLSRKNALERIYYRGNINNFSGNANVFGQRDAFNKIDWDEALEQKFDPRLVNEKILMLGYLGESIQNDKYWDEDKFYTPLNKKFAGKSFPDMYGVTVHANVISMVLNETYIDTMEEQITLIINLLLCFLNVVIFSYIHHYIKLWWDGLSVIVFITQFIFLVVLRLYVYYHYRIDIDISISMIFLFVLGNFLELYYEYAKPGALFVFRKISSAVKK